MNYYAIPPLIVGIIIFAIGFFVYSSNKEAKTHKIFALFCLSMSIWLICYSNMYINYYKPQVALTWARTGFIGVVFLSVFAYQFVLSLAKKKEPLFEKILLYTLGLLSIILSQNSLVYEGYKEYFWGIYPTAGPLYFYFLIAFILLTGRGTFILYQEYKKSKNGNNRLKSDQLFYVIIAFIGGMTGVVDYITKYSIPIYPFGYLSALFFISVIAYAITRLHLMDVQVVIKRTIVYSIVTAIIGLLFALAIATTNYLTTTIVGQNSIFISFAVAFCVALMLNPIKEYVQGIVDQLFFRTRYDYQKILRNYSRTLTKPITDLSKFAKIAPYLLWKNLMLTGSSFMVLNRATHKYEIIAGSGSSTKFVGTAIDEESTLIDEILLRRTFLSLEDLNYHIRNDDSLSQEKMERFKKIRSEMEKLNTVLIIPCISESEYFNRPTILSTINLGKKLSDEIFSKEDISFLETLANQSSILIEYTFILEELKKDQEQIVKSEKMAALGTITAGVAHELKNPITYIMTIAQLLQDMPDNKEVIASATKHLPAEAERMKLIVEGILGYSKNQELKLDDVDLKNVIEKVLAVISYDIKKNNIKISTNFQHTKFLKGDSNKLIQLFMNIIVNAIQAIGELGGEVEISSVDVEGGISIRIKDSGPGMSDELIEKIFNPFYSTKDIGTGLGLAIAQKITESHKGKISVTSGLGKGSTFEIYLPA